MGKEAYQEDWVRIGLDEDGTEAFLDQGGIVRDLETALYSVWLKHVPPQGSPTYHELESAVEGATKPGTMPHCLKQLIELDLVRGCSRTMTMIVCDRENGVLDAISFRFPDWTTIKEGSIIDMVRQTIVANFKERSVNLIPEELPLVLPEESDPVFSALNVDPTPSRRQTSNRYKLEPKGGARLKLERVDV